MKVIEDGEPVEPRRNEDFALDSRGGVNPGVW
jgi:hypothetical protein